MAKDSVNDYTVRHLEFNLQFLKMFGQAYLGWFIAYLTMNNMGIRTKICCIDYFFQAIFMIVRTIILLLFVKLFFYDLSVALLLSWELNEEIEGPYYTYEDPFNAMVARVFRSMLYIYTAFICFVILVITVAFRQVNR